MSELAKLINRADAVVKEMRFSTGLQRISLGAELRNIANRIVELAKEGN